MIICGLYVVMAISVFGVLFCNFSSRIDSEASAMISLLLECLFLACLTIFLAYAGV